MSGSKTILTTGLMLSIQKALSTSDGIIASTGGEGYKKGLFSFTRRRPKHISSVAMSKKKDKKTAIVVIVTNSRGVDSTHTFTAAPLTPANAYATGQSVAVLMATKKRAGELCGTEMKDFAEKLASLTEKVEEAVITFTSDDSKEVSAKVVLPKPKDNNKEAEGK